jgi:hypothetical protein
VQHVRAESCPVIRFASQPAGESSGSSLVNMFKWQAAGGSVLSLFQSCSPYFPPRNATTDITLEFAQLVWIRARHEEQSSTRRRLRSQSQSCTSVPKIGHRQCALFRRLSVTKKVQKTPGSPGGSTGSCCQTMLNPCKLKSVQVLAISWRFRQYVLVWHTSCHI